MLLVKRFKVWRLKLYISVIKNKKNKQANYSVLKLVKPKKDCS